MIEQKIELSRVRFWNALQAKHSRLTRYDPPKIILNNRIFRTAGYCKVDHAIVHLSAKLFQRNEHAMLNIILPHELCHQADIWLNGNPLNNRWHGKTWQALMVSIGLPPDTYHSLVV